MTTRTQIPTVPAHAEWFVRDRFGLFIHWGLYSIPARHEWVKSYERLTTADYERYFEHFDPDLYNPEAWAQEAKNAGMKYFVVTTKHHDGFCLWDSALTDYKAPNTPAGRDLLAPMVDAFRAQGLKVGFYHSLLDWHHPDYTVDVRHPQRDDLAERERNRQRHWPNYVDYLHGQTRELLTRYGHIDILWYDFSFSHQSTEWAHGKGKADWQSEKLVRLVRELQPHILMNDRLEVGGDLVTPEEYQPRTWMEKNGRRVLWEACQTFNGSWGYYRDNEHWKSPEMLIQMLIDTVAKGGNLLLNVGPNARGEFEPKALERLRAIGAWMRLHGRSIQGCGASAFTPPPDCRFTQNDRRLYLHLFTWPMKHVHLDGFAGKVAHAQLLNDGSEIRMIENDPKKRAYTVSMPQTAGTLTLELPVLKPPVAVPVIELFLKD